jgi:hypothetical protein
MGRYAPSRHSSVLRSRKRRFTVESLVALLTLTGSAGDQLPKHQILTFARRIAAFVERHPPVKMLALAFLILIGVMLVAEGLDGYIPKGYIYFSMAFASVSSC